MLLVGTLNLTSAVSEVLYIQLLTIRPASTLGLLSVLRLHLTFQHLNSFNCFNISCHSDAISKTLTCVSIYVLNPIFSFLKLIKKAVKDVPESDRLAHLLLMDAADRRPLLEARPACGHTL